MARGKKAWLEYSGQTTEELLAAKDSYSLDSLLCAFESGIEAKLGPRGEGGITEEERLVVAVMALDREVNNGGYDQFFFNDSQRFAPVIVDCLKRIACAATAEITARAIAALELEECAREEIFSTCDQEFYKLEEIAAKLFRFIESHQDRIPLVRTPVAVRVPPKTSLSSASQIDVRLMLARQEHLTLDGFRQLARELARRESIAATEADIEGAAVQHAFRCALNSCDLAGAEALAPLAFDLMAEDPVHSVLHRQWVELLIGASRWTMADAATVAYLGYLKGRNRSELGTQNNILFWAELLQQYRSALPLSVEFFKANLPERNLDEPLPARCFTRLPR